MLLKVAACLNWNGACFEFAGERIKVKLSAQSGFFRGFVIRAENALVNDRMGEYIFSFTKKGLV